MCQVTNEADECMYTHTHLVLRANTYVLSFVALYKAISRSDSWLLTLCLPRAHPLPRAHIYLSYLLPLKGLEMRIILVTT